MLYNSSKVLHISLTEKINCVYIWTTSRTLDIKIPYATFERNFIGESLGQLNLIIFTQLLLQCHLRSNLSSLICVKRHFLNYLGRATSSENRKVILGFET